MRTGAAGWSPGAVMPMPILTALVVIDHPFSARRCSS